MNALLGAPPGRHLAQRRSRPASSPPPQPYRPALDGLRVVAVLLVLGFHAGLPSLRGGFVGVDVFFVLSGLLITRLLLGGAGDGRVRLLEFYARRIRRLLPAALVTLVLTSLAWVAIASAVEREPLLGDARWAALYLANWHLVAQANDYFAAQGAPSPLEHFWSLSVEEQFYGLWPAVVAAGFLLGGRDPRRARRWLTIVAGILLVGSLAALAAATRHGQAVLAYYGTQMRAYQLLAGALLGLWWPGRSRPPAGRLGRAAVGAVQVLSLGGVALAASAAVGLGVAGRGVLACGLSVALLWALEADPRGAAARALSRPWMTDLGQLCYGTYLWHWPVIVIVRRFAVMAPGYLLAVAAPLSFGLAALSHRLLEQPIRHSRALARRARSVLVAGLAASLAAGILVLPAMLGAGRPPAVAPVSADAARPPAQPPGTARGRGTPVPSAQSLAAAGQSHPRRTCLQHVVPVGCLVRRGAGATVLLIGDSHMEALLPVFEQLAARHDLTLYTWMYYVCPWQPDVLPVGTNAEPCRADKATLYQRLLPQARPDVVIVINRGYDDPNYSRPLYREAAPRVTAPGAVLAAATGGAVDTIHAMGARLVVVEPWPALPFRQRDCLSRSRSVEQCAGRTAGKLASERALEARAAARHDLAVVDLDRAVCPRLPVCDAVIGGRVVRRDQDHLSLSFAASLLEGLDHRLTAAGAFKAQPR